MILRHRDPFGFERIVYRPGSGALAGNIRQLLRQSPLPPGPLDRRAIAGYLDDRRLPGHTVLQDVRAVPPGHALSRLPDGLRVTPLPAVPVPGHLETLLLRSLQRVVDSGRRTAIALSGGLDSALLLSLLHALGARDIPAYILAADMPGYGERDDALHTARRIGAGVVVVNVGAEDFIAALPDVMKHIDEPLFNLHPVAKLLLARAMRRDGIEVAISGDGADQVMTRDDSADYLPLCKALFEAADVTLVPPFLDDAVSMHLLSLPADPAKPCLRTLGARLGVAPALVSAPKRSRMAPAMDLRGLMSDERMAGLASAIGRPPPGLRTDAERVQWTTLGLLLADLGVDA